jgi:fibronectin-binding autotransporter adhesin
MKPHFNRFLALVAATVATSAPAAQLFKDGTGADINTLANWSTTNGVPGDDPMSFGTADQLRFNENTAASGTFTMDLSAALSVGNLTVDSGAAGGGFATGNFVIDSASNSILTLNGGGNPSYLTSGIVLNSSAGGTLTVNCDIALGATPVRFTVSRALTVNGDVSLGANTLEFNTAGSTTTLAGVISGTGGLNKAQGGQILALTNTANTFSGAVTLVGGTTQVTKLANSGADSSLGNSSNNIVLNGATLTFTGSGTDTTNRAIEMRAGAAINNTGTGTISFTAPNVSQTLTASARTMTVGGTNAGDNTFGSILGDSGTAPNISRLQKSGAGKWIIRGANTYTGATPINQGTLVVSGGGVLGGAAGSVLDEGNIWFTSTNSNGALHFETTANLGVADQIRFRNTGGTAGNGGALVYIGATNQTLGKTVQCDSSIGIRLESNSVGGSLTFNGPFSQTNRTLYLGGTGTGDNTLATAFTGSGGIFKRDAGTWILTGPNTYTGATTITGGTLALGASNVLANTAVTIGAATLAVGSGFGDTVGTLDPTAGATINLGSGATLAFAASNLIDWTDGTLNITGNFVSGSSLRFGDNVTQPGLTGDQLNKISAAGFTGFALDADGFLTATPAAGFSAWATANAPGQTIAQDHDGDGVPNGVEYFMGISGSGFTTNPVPNASNVVSWPKGASYTGAYGTDYAIQISSDLGISDPWTNVPFGNVTIDGDSVDYDLDAAPAGARKFARLKVTGP